ncbi:hypothetical protein [Streptomyces sp. T028]|uniref:hypothetical protein n=1 Tax=Streptomyces sp. T028 TaxID=3394379 RepID=UPI003A889684
MGTTKTQRILIVVGATLVTVVAMAASADTLAALGRAVGWGAVLAWSLPVSVDALALVAGLAWIAAGVGRKLGQVLTLTTVAVSVILNAVGHLVSTGHLKTSPYLVIAVSAVPPLAAALAVHLGATVNADRTLIPAETSALAKTGPGTPCTPSIDGAVPLTRASADAEPRTDSAGGPAHQSGPERAVRGHAGDRSGGQVRLRTTNQPTGSGPADHDAEAPRQRTSSTPDHTDQATGPGAQETAHKERTSNTAGQVRAERKRPADHERADDVGRPADEADHEGEDHGSPTDQMQARDHPQDTDHTLRTTGEPTQSARADHDAETPDQRTSPASEHTDQPADHDEDDSSGGPQGARTTHPDGSPSGAQSAAADQDDDVPWEVKVEVARKAALAEGRMTRRAIRPHLRKHNIKVSNELFGELQAHLYADPTLAHLPRTPRKTR